LFFGRKTNYGRSVRDRTSVIEVIDFVRVGIDSTGRVTVTHITAAGRPAVVCKYEALIGLKRLTYGKHRVGTE
jgi:hypothetical protein